jgi:hypothetical protein
MARKHYGAQISDMICVVVAPASKFGGVCRQPLKISGQYSASLSYGFGLSDVARDNAAISVPGSGGQEINTGEAGLIGWSTALKEHFTNWDVYFSNRLSERYGLLASSGCADGLTHPHAKAVSLYRLRYSDLIELEIHSAVHDVRVDGVTLQTARNRRSAGLNGMESSVELRRHLRP